MSQPLAYEIHFDLIDEVRGKSGQGGRKYFKLRGQEIHLQWDRAPSNLVRIHYIGSEGIMIFPLPGIFQKVKGSDVVFELDGKAPLELTLRDKAAITRQYGSSLLLDGKVVVFLSIFDKIHKTYAEGNSPPPIRLGP